VVEALYWRLVQESSRPVQEAIAGTLITIGGEAVVARVSGLLTSQDAYLRNLAVEILQALGQEAHATLLELLKNPDSDVRLFAVNALGEACYREAAAALREVVETDPNLNVVAAAVEYLGEMGLRQEDVVAIDRARKHFDDPFLDHVAEQALRKIRD
jgi:HEAT repeat protein